MTAGRSTCNTDKHCKCGNAARPGQRNCFACAAAANRAYRGRQANRRHAERKLALAGIAARARQQIKNGQPKGGETA